MPEIVLTEEQARILRDAKEPVIIHDAAMTVRVVSEPCDAVALANFYLQRRSGVEEVGVPAEKVAVYLKALDAEERRLGVRLTDEQIDEFIRRLENAEAA